MTQLERLSQELKAAMLSKDTERLSTLRLLKSAIGYAQIERETDTLPDAEVFAIIHKEVKKRREAVEQYEKGGRPELASKEKQEILVLESFLPRPRLSCGDRSGVSPPAPASSAPGEQSRRPAPCASEEASDRPAETMPASQSA